MDGSLSPNLEPSTETQASKKRKVVEKTVIRVKIRENNSNGKQKNEGPPSDFWSWRKYGQKPIKGSPYPRGYYKCSTSKGCSAKKQVERCKTDASMLIITYTSTHNHPCPDLNLMKLPKDPQTKPTMENPTSPTTHNQEQSQTQQEQEQSEKTQEENHEKILTTTDENNDDDHTSGDRFHYLDSPISCPQDIIIYPEDPFAEVITADDTSLSLLLDEEPPLSYQNLMTFSKAQKNSEENDFFDELEELLPTSSSAFSGFMKSNLFNEGIPVVPS